MEPFLVIFQRSILAILFLLIVVAFRNKENLRVNIADLPYLFLMGAIGIVATLWFLLEALKFTSVANTALIGSLAPVATTIAIAVIYKERFSPITYIGIALSFIGVIVLVTKGDLNALRNLSMNYGDILMFGNVLGSMTYAILIKRISSKYPALTMTIYMMIAAVIVLAFIVDFKHLTQLREVSNAGLISIIYLGVVASGIGYLLYNYTVTLIGPTLMSCTVFSSMPLFVMMLALYFFNEPITTISMISALLIAIGLYLTLKKKTS